MFLLDAQPEELAVRELLGHLLWHLLLAEYLNLKPSNVNLTVFE
jgi:hypothetical protein